MPNRIQPPPPSAPAHAGALGHQPETLAAFDRLYATLWSHGILDHATKEMARLRNARVTDCRFCRSVRFSAARDEGLTEVLVDEIRDGYETADALSPRQRATLRWTDAFLKDPGGVDQTLRAEMLRHFTSAELVELTAGLALFMGFSKIAVALDQMPEHLPVRVIPTPA
jgi:AhpD family alkylhydroperoxidase